MSFKEFNVTSVAGGHSVEEGKQTPRAGRARVSYSAALRHASDGLCVFRLMGRTLPLPKKT